jgi:hypothetical protein
MGYIYFSLLFITKDTSYFIFNYNISFMEYIYFLNAGNIMGLSFGGNFKIYWWLSKNNIR